VEDWNAGNNSPLMQLFILISEQGLTIYDFRSISDFMTME